MEDSGQDLCQGSGQVGESLTCLSQDNGIVPADSRNPLHIFSVEEHNHIGALKRLRARQLEGQDCQWQVPSRALGERWDVTRGCRFRPPPTHPVSCTVGGWSQLNKTKIVVVRVYGRMRSTADLLGLEDHTGP